MHRGLKLWNVRPPKFGAPARMSVFLLRRCLTLLATLVGASLIIFLVLDALPGNAAQMLMGADA